ncbi:MAG: hypothetical protein HY735_34115 [Verrucomicrobia bacterium]|nr:hypothetical protein [Verrucomicrobiota bacterium]
MNSTTSRSWFWFGFLALATLLPSNSQAQALLFSDDFDTDTSGNWDVFNGSGNGTPDFSAEFNFDYSKHKIPPAPNSTGNTTRGVKLNVNKNDDVANIAGVNIYPKGKTFSGNYALRFDMWMNYNGGAHGAGGTGTTEHGIFGLNHKGDKVNWTGAADSDGVWFGVTGEAGATRDYVAFEGVAGAAPAELRGQDAGFLDRDGDGSPEFEVNPTQANTFPLKAMLPSPPYETPGAPGKGWVQGEVRQRDGVITWLLNGYVIATRPNASGFASGNVMLGYMDTFNSIANPKEDNFILYDNVRVVSLDAAPALPEVSVEATDAEAAEPGTNSGTFTISRTGATTAPLEVRFRFAGTAVFGEDYATNALSAVIPAGASSVTVALKPLDDPKGEPAETVSLILTGGSNYDIGAAFRATVNLLDDADVTSVSIRATDAHMYERMAEDEGSFSISRLGDTAGDLLVNLAVGGTATSGKDYSGVSSPVVIPAGETNVVVTLAPEDDAEVEGDETVILSIASGPNYVIGASTNAVVTLRDNDLPVTPLLFADNFDSDTAANWVVLFGANNGVEDYSAQFAYDYNADSIPSAPHSTGGNTRGLRVAVNKTDSTASGIAGVNLYPKGRSFSGNYALRFDMFLSYGIDVGGSTEHAIFGINHSGSKTNRHATAGSDGLWFAIETDGTASGGGRSYVSYLSTNANAAPSFVAKSAREFDPVFTRPPYQTAGAPSGQWADVEVAQVGRTITWKINGKVIFQQANPSEFTSGNIMLGFMDTFASIGSLKNFVVFDNVRVVSLGEAPSETRITAITLLPDNRVQISFVTPTSELAAFEVQSSTTVTGPYRKEAGAVIKAGPQELTATIPRGSEEAKFYRIRQ